MEASPLYWLWLSSLPEVGINSKVALLQHFGTAEAAFQTEKGTFLHVDGVTRRDAELLEKRELAPAEQIVSSCRKEGLQIVTIEDPQYPERLKRIYGPPCVLYVKGTLPKIDREPVLAMVGTRDATEYGTEMAKQIAEEYVNCGGIVASGLTRGIDAASAEGALSADGRVIGFLGTPIQNAGALARKVLENGALISEYPPGTVPQKSFFRQRNRIGAGISVGVVAVEAPARSGTALFVSEALEQGKTVFAVPGNADSPQSMGTLRFLKEGAILITDGREIAQELRQYFRNEIRQPEISAEKTIDKDRSNRYIVNLEDLLTGLNEVQKQIVTAVFQGCRTVDEISVSTGLPVSRMLPQLTILEIRKILGRNEERQIVIPGKNDR